MSTVLLKHEEMEYVLKLHGQTIDTHIDTHCPLSD
jgi:hypothetical protein